MATGGFDIHLRMLGAVGLATALQQAADATWAAFGETLQRERDFRQRQLDRMVDDGGPVDRHSGFDDFTQAFLTKARASRGRRAAQWRLP
jgi:hypothetical protein